jgi:hypothetical protein
LRSVNVVFVLLVKIFAKFCKMREVLLFQKPTDRRGEEVEGDMEVEETSAEPKGKKTHHPREVPRRTREHDPESKRKETTGRVQASGPPQFDPTRTGERERDEEKNQRRKIRKDR